MSEQNNTAPLTGLEVGDDEMFRRVWNRVMPDQSLSPVTLRESQGKTVPEENHYIIGLEGLQDEVRQWQGTLEQLAVRHQGKTATALRTLAVGEQRQLRRLSALYFLLTAQHYLPRSSRLVGSERLRDSLRQGFIHQQSWCSRYTHMAEQLEGDAMIEIAQELHQSALEQSRQIRLLLESSLPQRRGSREHT